MRAVIGVVIGVIFFLSFGAAWFSHAFAAAATAEMVKTEAESAKANQAPAATTLAEVVVTGNQPGPGLWKIIKPGQGGEKNHVMWVLGTINPLPKRFKWDSTMVQGRIAQSQEVILAPRVSVGADIGFFGVMMLMPKALGARKNPGKQQLKDVMPEPLYARWLVLKAQYLKRNRSVEKQRPILAAHRLYEAALADSGLREQNLVSNVVRKTAKRNKRTITEPRVELKLADPKRALEEFAASNLDDLGCFEQTLNRVQSDLKGMRARANAWAIGDIQALQALSFTDQAQACRDAFLTAAMAKDRQLDDLPVRAQQAWIDAAVRALDQHERSFGVLRMSEMLIADGIGAKLKAMGYQVEMPAQNTASSQDDDAAFSQPVNQAVQ